MDQQQGHRAWQQRAADILQLRIGRRLIAPQARSPWFFVFRFWRGSGAWQKSSVATFHRSLNRLGGGAGPSPFLAPARRGAALCCWPLGSRQRWGYETFAHLPIVLLGQRGSPRCDSKPLGSSSSGSTCTARRNRGHCGEQSKALSCGLKACLTALANALAYQREDSRKFPR